MIGWVLRGFVALVILVLVVRFVLSSMRTYVAGARAQHDQRIDGPPPTTDVAWEAIRFRCATCGVELLLTRLPLINDEDQQLSPPRHCREEMALVADDLST